VGSPEAIELLYDVRSALVALRGVDASPESAYPLRALGRGNTWLASGKAFMKYYGIRVGTARRWIGRIEDDLLIVDLKEPASTFRSDKDRKPKTTFGALAISQLERPTILRAVSPRATNTRGPTHHCPERRRRRVWCPVDVGSIDPTG